MESELYCPLCNSEYSEQKHPRILSACGHTFCESCILAKTLPKGQQKYHIICPEDGIECQMTNPNPKQFPINRSLVRIAECNKSRISIKETSLDASKITKEEQLQQDEDTKQLRSVIKQTQLQQTTMNTKSVKQIIHSVLKQIESQDEENLCLLHQKPLDIICILDLKRICAKCAIFGQHKGHDFKSIEQIEQQKNIFYQQLLAVYDQKTEIINRIEKKTTKPDIMSILNSKKELINKQVKDRFKKLTDAIKIEQKKALAKLQKMTNQIQKIIDDLYIIDRQTIEEYQGWEKLSFEKLQIIEEGTFEEQLYLLLRSENKTQNNTITQGNQIIGKIKLHEQSIIGQAENFLSNVRVKSTDKIFDLLQSYVDVIDKPEFLKQPLNQKPKSSSHTVVFKNETNKKCFQDDLLQLEVNTEDTVRISKVQFVTKPINTLQFIDVKIEELKITKNLLPALKQITPRKGQKKLAVNEQAENFSKISQVTQQPRSQFASMQSSFISDSVVRPSKKKLKSIKVPEKYQKILENLYADSIETLDLTNAELGDTIIAQICSYLSGTKVKTVKLIRNKLTDDGLTKILPYMDNVMTLNLSQNMFTEKVLDIFITNRQKLPKVKNIILSMNKIIQRKHKNKIDELRKLQIIVSV